MFVVVVTRTVKRNTGATEKFAPRSANQTSLHVVGPFSTRRGAERAASAATATHTCLGAEVWTAEAVKAEAEKSYSRLGNDKWVVFNHAAKLISQAI